MKRAFILGISLCCLLGHVFAQSYFEGKIVFNVSLEGDNAEMMAALMPQNFQYLVKDEQIKFTIEGGMMEDMLGEFIVNADDGTGYMVQHSMKKAYKMDPPSPEETEEMEMKPEITKGEETKKIAGYTCDKYTITLSTPAGEMKQEVWATNEIKMRKPNFPETQGFSQIFINGMDAFPLRIQQDLPMGMGKMTLEASEVAPGAVDAKLFEFPSDYSVEKFDPEMFGKQMLGNYD